MVLSCKIRDVLIKKSYVVINVQKCHFTQKKTSAQLNCKQKVLSDPINTFDLISTYISVINEDILKTESQCTYLIKKSSRIVKILTFYLYLLQNYYTNELHNTSTAYYKNSKLWYKFVQI